MEAIYGLLGCLVRYLHAMQWGARALATVAAASDGVLFDHRRGRSVGRRVRCDFRSASLQRIQRVPDWAGRRVHPGLSRLDAQRSAGAVDWPQFRGAGPADGADVRRNHFGLRRGHQPAAGRRGAPQLLWNSARGGTQRQEWSAARTEPWPNSAWDAIFGSRKASLGHYVLRT